MSDLDADIESIEEFTKKMRELGIVSLKTQYIEIVLGPEPISHLGDSVPMEVSTPSDPSKLPPKSSPIWWSTPHYSATPEKKDE